MASNGVETLECHRDIRIARTVLLFERDQSSLSPSALESLHGIQKLLERLQVFETNPHATNLLIVARGMLHKATESQTRADSNTGELSILVERGRGESTILEYEGDMPDASAGKLTIAIPIEGNPYTHYEFSLVPGSNKIEIGVRSWGEKPPLSLQAALERLADVTKRDNVDGAGFEPAASSM